MISWIYSFSKRWRAKMVSNYSKDDLASILGFPSANTNHLDYESKSSTAFDMNQDAQILIEAPSNNIEENTVYLKSSENMHDYFKAKKGLEKRRRKRSKHPDS